MATFGLHLTTYPNPDTRDDLGGYLREVGEALEASRAFSTLWLTDHVEHLGPEGPAWPVLESHLALAAVAAATTQLELGVLATSVLYRNPALLAKMITTLDALSDGRAVLGIGAAHPRTEAEHRTYGYDFPPVGERMAALDDALILIRSMIGATPVPEAPPNWPRPARAGGIPILVAGSGEQRLLRIAARHADMVNLSFPSGDTLETLPHKLDVLARHCATVGRDPGSITVTYKGLLAVDRCRADAIEAGRRWCRTRGIPPLDERHGVFAGEPADITDQVRPYLDAGVDHLVVELATETDRKSVALAAEALSPLTESAA